MVWLLLLLLLACPAVSRAHVGEINVFFEGQAGPYPVRVVVRPPGVIPGLAEISVRVETNGVAGVTVLPVRWDTGRKGAPPPDEARLIRGETNLYNAQLWFMRGGAQSVEVEVRGAAGLGRVIVPVNAIATRVLGMPRFLGVLLAGLGLLLVALAVSIVGAAVRESILPAGVTPSRRRRWFAAATVVVAFIGVTTLLWLGQRWWALEAGDYRNNRLYRPVEAKVRLREENSRQVLNLERPIDPSKRNGPLVPEHGKLMHLFLVRTPGMDAFAHLHPVRVDWKTFETTLPDLPAGDYRVYADVTYETGLSDTLTAQVHLPGPVASGVNPSRDSDDGWRLSEAFNAQGGGLRQRAAISSNLWMELSVDGPLVENRDLRWRVKVSDVIFRPVPVEHYMGMGGHLILRREDGTVFTHLHPGGSFSMAAQQLFELRADGKAPLRVASAKDDPICQLPALDAGANVLRHDQLSFPYAFPKAGAYRLWVQVKVRGAVLTGVFDVKVAPAGNARYASADSSR